MLREIDSVLILACGTSYHAGMVARYWLEGVAGIPCNVEIASEYRYRDSVPNPKALVVTISQSGETADTLAALQYAKSLGHRILPLDLQRARIGAGARLGPALPHPRRPRDRRRLDQGVHDPARGAGAAHHRLAKLRGRLPAEREARLLHALRHLPSALQHVLQIEPQIKMWAEKFATRHHALFLGRGIHYPIAMEGALKLKEISYIHAEAYAAGELKHGPLALVDKDMPVVAIAPKDALFEKLKSNLQEVRARGGELHVFADQDTSMVDGDGVHVIRMPDHAGLLSPDPAHRSAAAARLSRRAGARQRRRQAAQSRQVGDRGVVHPSVNITNAKYCGDERAAAAAHEAVMCRERTQRKNGRLDLYLGVT